MSMIKPEHVIDHLFKTDGAGLSEEDKALFEKLKQTNGAVDQTERRLRELEQQAESAQTTLQQLHGRGRVLAELLYESHMKKSLSVVKTPAPAAEKDVKDGTPAPDAPKEPSTGG